MKSKYENDCLMMIDEEMYSVKLARGEQNCMYILDKGSQKCIMGLFSDLQVLFQISEKEFLVSFKQINGKNKLQHLEYDEENLMLSARYELVYDDSNDNNFLISKNVIVVRDNEKTTLYNYKKRKSFSFEDLQIIGIRQKISNTYLVGNIKIGNVEKIIMYIDNDSLEFGEFYSTLQDRYIKVIEDEGLDFRNRLGITLEQEIYKYVHYIEEYEEEMSSRNMINVCKKLEKKK